MSEMSAIPAAFMMAFEEHKRQEQDDNIEIDSVAYQANANAFEGGFARVLGCGGPRDADPNFIALKLCVVFDKLTNLMTDLRLDKRVKPYASGDTLFAAMEGVRTAWRMVDAHGGDGVRPFARYVGIVEKSDEISWEHEAQRASVKEAA